MRLFFIIITGGLTVLIWIATLFGTSAWVLDLIAQCSLYLVALIIIHIGILAVYRAWKWVAAFAFGILVYAVIFVFPITLFGTPVKKIPAHPDVLFMNTLYFNDDVRPIVRAVDALSPKTVAMVEINHPLEQSMQKRYGAPLAYNDAEGLSCAIFSTEKPITAMVVQKEYPTCVAEFQHYVLIAAHTIPPYTQAYWKAQAAYYDSILSLVQTYQSQGIPVLITADMNGSWFSPLLRHRFRAERIRMFLSWHGGDGIMLPIDHVIPFGLTIKRTYMLPQMTSDHRGLAVFFGMV